jgi:hypothetical protein
MKGEFGSCCNIVGDLSIAMLQCGKAFAGVGFRANG